MCLLYFLKTYSELKGDNYEAALKAQIIENYLSTGILRGTSIKANLGHSM